MEIKKLRRVQTKRIKGKNPVMSITIPREYCKQLELCAGEQLSVELVSRNRLLISKLSTSLQEKEPN